MTRGVSGFEYTSRMSGGALFGYTGSFQVEWREVGQGGVPAGILPRRLERRE